MTWESDDVERYTKEALSAGADTIVAAGKAITARAAEEKIWHEHVAHDS